MTGELMSVPERDQHARWICGHWAAVGVLMSVLLFPHKSAWADRAQAKYWLDHGIAQEDGGNVDGALQSYQKAIVEDPDYELAYERAAPLWMRAQAFDVAITKLERFTLRHPRRAFAWYALAYAYRRTGRLQHAALCYESYIELRPDEAAAYFGLGMVRLQSRDKSGARRAFERYVALETDPSRADYVAQARRELADLQWTGTPRDSMSGAARGQLARIREHMAKHRYEAAHTLARAVHPDSHRQALELAVLRARILIALGQVQEARKLLWSVVAAAPARVDAHMMLRGL